MLMPTDGHNIATSILAFCLLICPKGICHAKKIAYLIAKILLNPNHIQQQIHSSQNFYQQNSMALKVLIFLLIALIAKCLANNHGPTIRHNAGFNARHTAQHLHAAMEKKNESEVAQAICTIDNQQRQQLASEFKKEFGTDLVVALEKAFKGHFEEMIIALMQTPAVYDANQMHEAMSGMRTNDPLLIEILSTRSNRQIAEMKHEYERLNKKRPLEQDIKAHTKGPFQNLLVSLLNGSRDEHRETDLALAHEEAVKLYREGEARRGVNAAAFNQVLANRNFAQLRITFDHYKQLSHHDIEQAIEHEFSGDNEAGFLALAKCVRNSSVYFANLLHKSMKGLGTRDSDLIRLVVSRSEIDLAEIKYAYHVLHQKPLEDAIQGDTSGAYRDGLLALVRGNH